MHSMSRVVTRVTSQPILSVLVRILLYPLALRTNVEVYRNGFFSKLSPRPNQQSHARSSSTNSERHSVVRVHHFVASWTLQAFLCGPRFFRWRFHMLVKMFV